MVYLGKSWPWSFDHRNFGPFIQVTRETLLPCVIGVTLCGTLESKTIIVPFSFGAFTILMFLIRENSASKTVSLLFLVPPTSALMAWYFLNENLYTIDLIGFGLTSFGVFIATRKN